MKEDINYYALDTDDIVFDNRNKNYGAFLLRKKYIRNLLKSISISISIFTLAMFTPFILSKLNFFDEPPEEVLIRREINLADAPPAMAQASSKSASATQGEIEAVEKKDADEEKKITEPTEPNKNNSVQDTADNYLKNGKGKEGKTAGGTGADIYDISKVEIKPIFKGGDEAYGYFFEDNLKHPNANLTGVIYVSFIIEKNGDISDINTDNKGNPKLEIAAKECIAKMKGCWIPARQGGKEVRVICKVPVEF